MVAASILMILYTVQLVSLPFNGSMVSILLAFGKSLDLEAYMYICMCVKFIELFVTIYI